MINIFGSRPLTADRRIGLLRPLADAPRATLLAVVFVGIFLQASPRAAASMEEDPSDQTPPVEQTDLKTRPNAPEPASPPGETPAQAPSETAPGSETPPPSDPEPALPRDSDRSTPPTLPEAEPRAPAPLPKDGRPKRGKPSEVPERDAEDQDAQPTSPADAALPQRSDEPVANSEAPSVPDSESDQAGTDIVALAHRLRLGVDGPPDVARALELLHNASLRGNSWAMFALAEIYRLGEDVPADHEKAEILYHRTREGADPAAAKLAAYSLGELYSDGPLRNAPKAVEHYRRAAEAGLPWGMYDLAEIYRTGKGVPAVPSEAETLYRSALATGDAEVAKVAAYGLGELYSSGPLHNPEEAVRAYRQAADAGHPWGLYALAECYREGIGVTADQRTAEDLLLRAHASGDAEAAKVAAYTLAELYRSDGPLPDNEKALRFYVESADAGHPWSLLALAEMHRKGSGVTADETRAREYYEKAQGAGDPEVAEAAARALAPPPIAESPPATLDAVAVAEESPPPTPEAVSAPDEARPPPAEEPVSAPAPPPGTVLAEEAAPDGTRAPKPDDPIEKSSPVAEAPPVHATPPAVPVNDPPPVAERPAVAEVLTAEAIAPAEPNDDRSSAATETPVVEATARVGQEDEEKDDESSSKPDSAEELEIAGPISKPPGKRLTGRKRVVLWETFARAERYRKGSGGAADLREAAALYKAVIEKADPDATREAAYRLAQIYSKEPLRDPEAAAAYYRMAADHGSSWAAYSLAGLYKNGVGVAQDRKMARMLYLRAIRSSDGGAAGAARRALGSLDP